MTGGMWICGNDREIKFREETLPTLRQTGESASLNLPPSPNLVSDRSLQLDPGLLRLGRLCLEPRTCIYDSEGDVQLGRKQPVPLNIETWPQSTEVDLKLTGV